MGKVLIEKLLREFSIKRIYLLVRVKNNMTVNERLEKFFQESVMISAFSFILETFRIETSQFDAVKY